MENKVYTQNELKAQNIITMDYALNLEPGEFVAVLNLKAQARRRRATVCASSSPLRTAGRSWQQPSGGRGT